MRNEGNRNVLKPAIIVTSGKGGVGKTLIAINLALELSKTMKVALIDADVRAPNLTYVMGIAGKKLSVNEERMIVPYQYSDTLQIFSTEHLFSRDDGLKGALIFPGEEVRSIIDHAVFGVAWDNPDVYVIDSDPSTSDVLIEFHNILGDYLNAILVSTNDISSRNDVERMIVALMVRKIAILGLIGNMIFDNQDAELRQLAEKFGIKYFGYIPFDNTIRINNNNGKPEIGGDIMKKIVGEITWQRQS